MNSLQLNLFESTNANFRLSVNGMFSKKNPTTNADFPLIRVSQNGNATCAPNVFLVFTYMTDSFETTKSVYTSNPHMSRIRTAMSFIYNALGDKDTFINNNGVLIVNDKYREPQIIANIGKKNAWISLRITADSLLDPNNNQMPAIELALSESQSTCILTLDEFYTLYEIIEHISLPEMALIMSVAELNDQGRRPAAPQQNYNNYGGNYGGYNRQAQQPRQYQPRQYAAPNQYGATTTGANNYTNTPASTTSQAQYTHQNTYATGNWMPHSAANQTPAQDALAPEVTPYNFMNNTPSTPISRSENFPPKGGLQPRSGSLMGNTNAIESIPTEDLDLGDEGLEDLFSKGSN